MGRRSLIRSREVLVLNYGNPQRSLRAKPLFNRIKVDQLDLVGQNFQFSVPPESLNSKHLQTLHSRVPKAPNLTLSKIPTSPPQPSEPSEHAEALAPAPGPLAAPGGLEELNSWSVLCWGRNCAIWRALSPEHMPAICLGTQGTHMHQSWI